MLQKSFFISFTLVLSIAIIIGLSFSSFASAKEVYSTSKIKSLHQQIKPMNLNEQQLFKNIDQQTLSNINMAIKTSIIKENDQYILDVKKARESGLNETEISNLKEGVSLAPQSELAQLVNTTSFNVTAGFPLALQWILITLLGVTLAETVISDAYHVGMKAACHKIGKNHATVKKACKYIGYW